MSTATHNDVDNTVYPPGDRPQLVLGEQSYQALNEAICGVVEHPPASTAWYALFSLTVAGTIMLVANITYLLCTGVGVWGNNIPVAWAWDIVNFVFWIGIGHAGTLI